MKMKLLAVSLAACLLGVLLAFYYVMTIASTHVGLDDRGDLLPMRAVERTVVTHDDAVAHQHAPHEVEEVEEGKLDDDGQLIDEPVQVEEEEPAPVNSMSYAMSNNGDGFMQQGVRDYGDTTETWYSSNQTYHERTGEWTPDDEGYYRDSEGYYVVASEDHAQGEVIDTSKGKAKVYDSGCDNGVTDFYVNF